jgi:RNA polymerase sigma-70 factor (ECF subfamily)
MDDLSQYTDEDIAGMAQRGSVACFEELVRRYQAPLMGFLTRRFCANPHDAEDVIQEVFFKAHRYLHRYSQRWKFKTWIFTLAHRESVSHGRKGHKTAAMPQDLPGRVPPPDMVLSRKDANEQLWLRVRTVLSEKQFALVWLYYAEGMSLTEIAVITGGTTTSVAVMLHRCRGRLHTLADLSDESSARRVHERPPAL